MAHRDHPNSRQVVHTHTYLFHRASADHPEPPTRGGGHGVKGPPVVKALYRYKRATQKQKGPMHVKGAIEVNLKQDGGQKCFRLLNLRTYPLLSHFQNDECSIVLLQIQLAILYFYVGGLV